MSASLTLSKEERISSKKLIDQLFTGGGSHSMAAFPLRVVYMQQPVSEGEENIQILISVPKRYFKRAVKRNRVKRQVREAYRKHKALLRNALAAHPSQSLYIAFIWLSDELCDSQHVEQRWEGLLRRIAERL